MLAGDWVLLHPKIIQSDWIAMDCQLRGAIINSKFEFSMIFCRQFDWIENKFAIEIEYLD